MQRSIDNNLTPTDYDQGWSKIEKKIDEDYNEQLSKLTSDGNFTMASVLKVLIKNNLIIF